MKYQNGIALGSMFLYAINSFAADEATKPNIILIMTDQQSYNMISALSQYNTLNPNYSSTPNLDRLVNSGISFTNTYCANPVSVPSRFALFTGEFGGKYNVRDNTCPDADQTKSLALFQKSAMGNIFLRNGYQTYYGGKVHLPFAKNTNKFAEPINYGFTTYITDDERDGLGDIAADFIKKRTGSTPFLFVVSFLNPHDICLESSTNLSPDLYVDPNKPEIAATIAAVRAEAAAYDSINFYTNIAPALPVNYLKTDGFPEKFTPGVFDPFPDYYWQKYRWIYSRLVSGVDANIGKVLNAIDQSSVKGNTIIIFTSDHGEMQGAHHATVKNLPFEECQRVPFIISGKGIVQNQQDNSLVCNGTDLIPTMCELAGIAVPTNLEGISLAARSTVGTEVVQRKYLYTEGDGFTQIIENPRYKYTTFDVKSGTSEMLIDLQNDPGEMFNVYSKNTAYKNKTAELNNVLVNELYTSVEKPVLTKIHLYPNPTSNYLLIDGLADNEQIRIYNIIGAEVSQHVTTSFTGNNTAQINLRNLNEGIYIVQSKTFTGKFVVK